MKEASISLSCSAVIQQKLSTCLQWCYPMRSAGKVLPNARPNITIQVLPPSSRMVFSLFKSNVINRILKIKVV
jgi:hypothetical protein